MNNPLDDVFNTEPFAQNAIDVPQSNEIIIASPEADEEDKEIDRKIDTVYDAAIDAFNQQTAYTEVIEPRYAARNAEVAANFLTIALNAATNRAAVKHNRKKLMPVAPFGGNIPNGNVRATREEIMAMITIDAEQKDKE